MQVVTLTELMVGARSGHEYNSYPVHVNIFVLVCVCVCLSEKPPYHYLTYHVVRVTEHQVDLYVHGCI